MALISLKCKRHQWLVEQQEDLRMQQMPFSTQHHSSKQWRSSFLFGLQDQVWGWKGHGFAAQHGACQGMAQSSLGKSCHALWVLTRRDTSWLLLGRLGWAFVLPAFVLPDGRSKLSGWPFIKTSPCLYSHKWWGRNFCLLLIRLIKAAFSPFSSLKCSLP